MFRFEPSARQLVMLTRKNAFHDACLSTQIYANNLDLANDSVSMLFV